MSRNVLLSVVLWTLVALGAVQAAAQEAVPAAKPDWAQLRAEWHRTVAALIDAQAAEKPDPAKVKELTEKLRALRAQLPQTSGFGGMGPGWGRGACAGTGMGMGMGLGRGMGPGAGWCGGRGPGAGWGPGLARGPGYGRGAGGGANAGWGRAFVDENQNGICDHFERARGTK
ncbi:MAG: hypothetical protein NUV77_24215 [Thermoguttaceae bacterium]|jgi:hypothetical protein|nr:hypothetical protein [Thermoguttaceae bacterium]